MCVVGEETGNVVEGKSRSKARGIAEEIREGKRGDEGGEGRRRA